MEKYLKPYDELTFTDDFLFARIMRNEEICKEVVELLLDVKVSKITYIDAQKDEKETYLSHGVRFDVYIEDSDKIIDIEMQTSRKPDILQRSLYYQSMIAVKNLQEGRSYSEMKESYVIFICLFDVFCKQAYKYSLKTICEEFPALKINDKTNRIFYNVNEYAKCPNALLQAFLKYLSTREASSTFTDKLDKAVSLQKANEDWRHHYMTLEMKLNESKQEGIAIGEAQKAIETAKIAIQNNLSLEMIAKLTGLSLDEIISIKNEM